MKTLNIIEGAYFKDLLAQPEALRDTLRALTAQPLQLPRSAGRRPIVLTGMGASLYALQPLALRLNRSGMRATVVETADLLDYGPRWPGGSLLVAVSQSGRSAELVRLLGSRRPDWLTVGITNGPDSPLARKADIPVVLRAGSESSVSCKTYVATLAALASLGDLLCGVPPQRSLRALGRAAGLMEAYLAGWRRHVADIARLLGGMRRLFYVGRGDSLAAARSAGLITKEAARFHAEGMSAPAFRHGPFELAGPDTVVVVFEGVGQARERNKGLAADIRRVGGHAELVGPGARCRAFRLPVVPPVARPVLEILPAQMTTLALAALAGNEAGHFTRATKVTEVE